MKALALLAATAVLCSCGPAEKSPSGSNSSQASAAGTASAPRQGSPVPSVSQLPNLPLVALAPFPNCRLPYLKSSLADSHLAGGFVPSSQGLRAAVPKGAITSRCDY